MASTDSEKPRPSLFSRAADLLRFQRAPGAAVSPNLGPIAEDRAVDGTQEKLNHNNGKQVGSQSASQDVASTDDEWDRRRHITPIPPWARFGDPDGDDEDSQPSSYLFPTPSKPSSTKSPHHNFMPTPKHKTEPGRRYDHQRTRQPVIITSPVSRAADRWGPFSQSPSSSDDTREDSHLVSEDWKKDNLPDLERPWNPDREVVTPPQGLWLFSSSRRTAKIDHFHDIMMRNPFIPLLIRLTVMMFVLIALGIGVTIYRRSNYINNSPSERAGVNTSPDRIDDVVCAQQASTYMAFIVDSIAVIYLLYISWDESTSKPIGLRRSRDKIRLLFLDLLFIVFSAANVSLAFNTLYDGQWACASGGPDVASNNQNTEVASTTCVMDADLCKRQRTLCGVLILALFAWTGTFAISVLRVVEQISR